ncbi:MAG: MbnP family protein [Bacteroidota bacterium]
MKKILFLFTIVALFMAASCDDDQVLGDTGSVNLNFKAVYAGEPLVFQNSEFTYKYPESFPIRFNDLRFFISEVALVEEEGSDEAVLFELDYLSFSENSTLEEAERATTYPLDNIPAGNYKALKFSIGVPADLNNDNFTDYGVNHPLRSNSGEYWSGWDSFIFMKINGSFDKDGDGLGMGDDASLGHHLGGDDYFKTVTLEKAIVVDPDQSADLNITLDLVEFYQNDAGQILDLTIPENWATHNTDNIEPLVFLTNNFERGFTIE